MPLYQAIRIRAWQHWSGKETTLETNSGLHRFIFAIDISRDAGAYAFGFESEGFDFDLALQLGLWMTIRSAEMSLDLIGYWPAICGMGDGPVKTRISHVDRWSCDVDKHLLERELLLWIYAPSFPFRVWGALQHLSSESFWMPKIPNPCNPRSLITITFEPRRIWAFGPPKMMPHETGVDPIRTDVRETLPINN